MALCFATCVAQAYYQRQDLPEERDNWDLQREVVRQRSMRSKRLHSIPEVAEDEAESGVVVETMGQRPRFDDQRPGTPRRGPRVYHQDSRQHNRLSPSKCIRRLQRQRSSPRYSSLDDRGPGGPGWMSVRQATKSPDSGLDCGSEEEGSLGYRAMYSYGAGSPMRVGVGPSMRLIHCEGPVERRALAAGRKRTLTRQSSIEEDFLDVNMDMRSRRSDLGGYYHHPHYRQHYHPHPQRRFQSEGRLTDVGRSYYRETRAHSVARLNRGMDEPLVCVTDFSLRPAPHSHTHPPTPTLNLSPPPHLSAALSSHF